MAPFTPIESLAGGILMGMSVAAYAGLLGRITGMSGAIGNLITDATNLVKGVGCFIKSKIKGCESGCSFKTQRTWKDVAMSIAYIAGLIVAGGILRLIAISKIIEPFNGYSLASITWAPTPPMPIHPILLFVIAGFLVGFGTYIGSGCTSGHMLCGLARLSPRSIVATMVFCVMALVTSKGLDTQSWINKYFEPVQPSYFPEELGISVHIPSLETGIFLLCIVIAMMLVFIVLVALSAALKKLSINESQVMNSSTSQIKLQVDDPIDSKEDKEEEEAVVKSDSKETARQEPEKQTIIQMAMSILQIVITFVCALSFGIGLALSGMTLPQHVLGFFDFSPNWDPSLVMVIVGAVLPNLIFFQSVILPLTRKQYSPLAQESKNKFGKFFLPSSWSGVTARLIVGEALFGVGWGLTGICPGPAMVSIFTGFEVLYFLLGQFVGRIVAMLF